MSFNTLEVGLWTCNRCGAELIVRSGLVLPEGWTSQEAQLHAHSFLRRMYIQHVQQAGKIDLCPGCSADHEHVISG